MADPKQLPDRLSRHERNFPTPDPDNVDACLATGSRVGADMYAICLPMPKLTDQSRDRITRMFPRTPHGPQRTDAWSKQPTFGDRVTRDRQGRSR